MPLPAGLQGFNYKNGTHGWIRTSNFWLLKPVPLPVGPRGHLFWCPREDSNLQNLGSKPSAYAKFGYAGMVRSEGIEPLGSHLHYFLPTGLQPASRSTPQIVAEGTGFEPAQAVNPPD